MAYKKTELSLDNVNPYEVRRGLNIELESIDKEDKDRKNKATKKVLENLAVHPAYYSELENFNSLHMNETKKPSFKKYLKDKNKETDMVEANLRESIRKYADRILKEEYISAINHLNTY